MQRMRRMNTYKVGTDVTVSWRLRGDWTNSKFPNALNAMKTTLSVDYTLLTQITTGCGSEGGVGAVLSPLWVTGDWLVVMRKFALSRRGYFTSGSSSITRIWSTTTGQTTTFTRSLFLIIHIRDSTHDENRGEWICGESVQGKDQERECWGKTIIRVSKYWSMRVGGSRIEWPEREEMETLQSIRDINTLMIKT